MVLWVWRFNQTVHSYGLKMIYVGWRRKVRIMFRVSWHCGRMWHHRCKGKFGSMALRPEIR